MNFIKYQNTYKLLNEQQKLAVDTIEGPVMVVAGPGTGKTQVLALRIANIIKQTDTPPYAILCLTFTESGKQAMRQRLFKFIGNQAYYVIIETFHSFCSSIIKDNPGYFDFGVFGDPVSDLKKISIISKIIDQHDFASLKPAGKPYLYVNAIIQSIQELKREGYNPHKFKNFLNKQNQDKNQTKLQELHQVFNKYQTQLHLNENYDYEDMIIKVLYAFQNHPELLRIYQEKFLYLLADEYQDTNTAQNNILFQLASFWKQQANIFVVGDPDQSIYRFQGASIENILSFQKQYPNCRSIHLVNNYRSQQKILNAAYQIIKNNNLKAADLLKTTDQPLKSQITYQSQPIDIAQFPNEIFEYYYISKQIKNLTKQGTSASQIAILYRNNADAAAIADILSKMEIPYNLEGGENILHTGEISRLLTLLKVLNKLKTKEEDLDMFTLLQYDFWGIPQLDIYKISRFASEQKINLLEAFSKLPKINKQYELERHDTISKIWQQILEWTKLDANITFTAFFETLINQSGYLNWLLKQPNSTHRLNKLQSLFKFIKQLNRENHTLNLSSFLNTINLMENNNLAIVEDDLDVDVDAVRLSTAHKSKGLEFEHVFIIKCYDTKWGNKRIPQLIKIPSDIVSKIDLNKKEKNEDERRLFYVALTRAKLTCTITYSDQYDDKQVNPSMFITEINSSQTQIINTDHLTKQQTQILTTILQPSPDQMPTPSEKDFMSTIIDKLILSPTALNTYLTCPYKFKLQQILRTPRAKAEAMAYGTAVHYAMEKYFTKYKETNQLPEIQIMLDLFNSALDKEVIPDTNKNNWKKRGQENLKLYIQHYQTKLQPPIKTEKYFGGSFNPIYINDIPISGKVDKIELITEPIKSKKQKLTTTSYDKKSVRLIDYKTGTPKSRNAIEGKTKYSKADYKRQLVFYQLLSQLDKTFPYQVTQTQLDFVEPNTNGKFKQETFVISRDEVKELKELIKTTMTKIRNQEFPRTTEYTNCKLCEFKTHCWPGEVPK